MRALLILLAALGLFSTVQAADATRGRVIKVLPVFLDRQGRDATTPSLFDRDAYQAFLRLHTNQISAVRYNVLWKAKPGGGKIVLRTELRGVDGAGLPKLTKLEAEVTPKSFSQWSHLTLEGAAYEKFGAAVAWRVTLWDGDQLLSEQKSFLW